MANVFLTLPVPAGDGVGAWVDVSSLGPEKTLTVDGGKFGGSLYLEASNDAQASSAPAAVGPFVGGFSAPQTFVQALQFMRVRRAGSGGVGTPSVGVAGPSAISNIFGAMNVPTSDGPGTPIALSGGGDVNTFQVVGPFVGQVLIETSSDGTNFVPTLIFDSGGGVGQTVTGVLNSARVVRRGTGGGAGPLVSVGSGATSGAAGGGFPGYGGTPPAIGTGAAGVSALVSRADHTHDGVHTVNGAGGDVTVTAFPGFGGTPPAVGTGAAGTATTASHSDHTHDGVHTVNGAGGDVVVTAFPGFGGAPPAVGTSAAGVAATGSRSDHTHDGVASYAGAKGALTEVDDSLLPVAVVGTVITRGQNIQANWTLGICRVYAVDGVNGNDANKGYADPTTSSAADYAIACAAAGAVAKKTLAGLGAIFPRVGANRLVEIVVAAGTYADALDTLLGGMTGYATNSALRGTATNATAGSVAFDGSVNDCTYAGTATVAGLNATGYNPDAATGALLTLTKVGGGSPAFPAEPAMPLMMCLRWDVNCTTAALRGTCDLVLAVPGATQVQLSRSITRVASDTCYIEDGGVVVTPTSSLGENGMSIAGLNSGGFQLVGVHFTAQCRVNGGKWSFQKCSATGLGNVRGKLWVGLLNSPAYAHPVRGTLVVGGGLNCTGASQTSFADGAITKPYGFVSAGTLIIDSAMCPSLPPSNVVGAITFNGPTAGTSNNPVGAGATTTANQPVRVIGPPVGTRGLLDIEDGIVRLGGLDCQNAGALPAVRLYGFGVIVQGDKHGGLTGSAGNTDVGLDSTLAYGCTFSWGIRPTVTGTLGDVRLPGGSIVTWAAALALGVDTQGNRYAGP